MRPQFKDTYFFHQALCKLPQICILNNFICSDTTHGHGLCMHACVYVCMRTCSSQPSRCLDYRGRISYLRENYHKCMHACIHMRTYMRTVSIFEKKLAYKTTAKNQDKLQVAQSLRCFDHRDHCLHMRHFAPKLQRAAQRVAEHVLNLWMYVCESVCLYVCI